MGFRHDWISCQCAWCGRIFKMSKTQYNTRMKGNRSGHLFHNAECYKQWAHSDEGRWYSTRGREDRLVRPYPGRSMRFDHPDRAERSPFSHVTVGEQDGKAY